MSSQKRRQWTAEQKLQIIEEARQAARGFALAHPKMGYKRLAWQMVDKKEWLKLHTPTNS
jgi:hypothetical protein